MESLLFHSSILSINTEMLNNGRLPSGLIKEVLNAEKVAQKIISDLQLRKRGIEIDREVLKKSDYFAEDLLTTFSKMGLFLKFIPKFLGGEGGHPLSVYFFNLQLSKACLGLTNLLGPHYVALGLLFATNSLRIIDKIVKDIKKAQEDGSHCCLSIAITEPNAGSDLEDDELIQKASVMTRAKKVEGGYVINGQKMFISNALFAKWFVVSAFTDVTRPKESLVIFVLPKNTRGLSLGRTEKKLGQAASPASVVFLDNVFVPDSDIALASDFFSNKEDYIKYSTCLLNDLLALSRAGVGALATGIQARALEIIQDNVLDESEFIIKEKARIVSNLIISKQLSWQGHIECLMHGPYKDMVDSKKYAVLKLINPFWFKFFLNKKTEDALRKKRLLSYNLSHEKIVQGHGALVKYKCSDLAMESLAIAQELLGMTSVESYFELEKMYRDTKLLQIYEGANEINLLLVAKSFLGYEEKSMLVFNERAV